MKAYTDKMKSLIKSLKETKEFKDLERYINEVSRVDDDLIDDDPELFRQLDAFAFLTADAYDAIYKETKKKNNTLKKMRKVLGYTF